MEREQDGPAALSPRAREDMPVEVAAALRLPLATTVTESQTAAIVAGRAADGTDQPGSQQRHAALKVRYVDFVFAPDPSVSIAHGLAATEAGRGLVLEAMRGAVDDALAHIEDRLAWARRGPGGNGEPEKGRVGWFIYEHATAQASRSGEPGAPHLHFHAVIPNMVVCPSGHVGSMDLRRLRGRVGEFDAVFNASLATRLRAVGAKVAMDPRTGAAVLPEVPRAYRDAIGRRTREAEQEARAWAASKGLEWDKLSAAGRNSLIRTGAAKSRRMGEHDPMADRDAWAAEAARFKYAPRDVAHPERARQDDPYPRSRIARAYLAARPLVEREMRHEATVPAAKVRVMAARGLVASGIGTPKDIDAVLRMFRERGIRQDGRETALIWAQDIGGNGWRVTTALHEAQETEFIRLARAAEGNKRHALTPAEVETGVGRLLKDQPRLTFAGAHGAAQRAAIEHLGTAGGIAAINGAAGAGKSTLVAALVNAWDRKGLTAWGTGLAWNYADNLKGSGITPDRALAMDPLLRGLAGETISLGPRDVVVVDEAPRIGTRQMLDLLHWQERQGFALRLIGDDRQPHSVEAGSSYALLRRALGPGAIPEIATTVRQRSPDKAKQDRERRIAGLFRGGEAATALALKREDKTIELVAGTGREDGYRRTVERAADLWMERVAANRDQKGFSVTLSVPTNADAHAVGLAIRERRKAAGELGREEFTVRNAEGGAGQRYDLTLSQGDRVRVFRKTLGQTADGRWLWIANNGGWATITARREEGLVLRGPHGEALVTWDRMQDRGTGRVRLALGYAVTHDAIQSATSGEHINVMPAGSGALAGQSGKNYVAESRHIATAWTLISRAHEEGDIRRRLPLAESGREIGGGEVWANVARNLSVQAPKASATELLTRAIEVRRGAIRDRHLAMQPIEAGKPAGGLAQRIEALQVGKAVERMAVAVRDAAAEMRRAFAALPGRVAAMVRARRQAREVPRNEVPTPSGPNFPNVARGPSLREQRDGRLLAIAQDKAPMVAMDQWGLDRAVSSALRDEMRHRGLDAAPVGDRNRGRLLRVLEPRMEAMIEREAGVWNARMEANAERVAAGRMAERAKEYASMVVLGAWDEAKAVGLIAREEANRDVAYVVPTAILRAKATEAVAAAVVAARARAPQAPPAPARSQGRGMGMTR